LARRVAEEFGDDNLVERLNLGGQRGVDGELKNIIFASTGPKPRIVMRDAINNVIDVIEHADSCLVYDRALNSPGLTWGELTEWWATKRRADDPARSLYQRLYKSLDSPPEQVLFRECCKRYGNEEGLAVPVLLPQVYLHYDPYLRTQRAHTAGEINVNEWTSYCYCQIEHV
jgi:hypothetical protein